MRVLPLRIGLTTRTDITHMETPQLHATTKPAPMQAALRHAACPGLLGCMRMHAACRGELPSTRKHRADGSEPCRVMQRTLRSLSMTTRTAFRKAHTASSRFSCCADAAPAATAAGSQ